MSKKKITFVYRPTPEKQIDEEIFREVQKKIAKIHVRKSLEKNRQ
ncbi:hypothetical protein [Neobacillus drentensis]|nr:hypothetical protein [Neobacillus drentensis]MDR7237325.1 hypothetical protein [Neobacillus drentensis]